MSFSTFRTAAVLLSLCIASVSSCGKVEGPDDDGDSDADTDTDVDTDIDSDIDSDIDTDGECLITLEDLCSARVDCGLDKSIPGCMDTGGDCRPDRRGMYVDCACDCVVEYWYDSVCLGLGVCIDACRATAGC